MKTDVLTRTRLVLGIEKEPIVRPPVATKDKGQAAVKLPDKTEIADVLERAKAASAPQPQPQPVLRRVEIMMTGNVGRVGVVRKAVQGLQTQLFGQIGGNHLELRLTAFLDDCRHTTPWSRSPIDVGSKTTAWHCFQGSTRYAEALAYSADEGEPIDAIIIFGDRFDDDLPATLRIANRLQKQGTRVYAFHVGGKSRSRHAYDQLAAHTGGAFVQLSDQRAFGRIMPVIAAYLLRPAETLRALPPPKDADTRALVDRLKLLPPPPNPLRLTGRTS